MAAAFGALAALGFAILPLARAREIAPAGLFRDLVAPSRTRGRWPYRAAALIAFLAIGALSVALSPYPWFSLVFLGGAAAVLALLRAGGWRIAPRFSRAFPTAARKFRGSRSAISRAPARRRCR